MKESNLIREALLNAIGLQEVMTERNYIDPFDKNLFHQYTPNDYLNSSRREMDEVYRMSEVVLLHKETGLRVEYLTTESYYGDELRYRCRDVFILAKDGRRITVTAIDRNKKLFEIPEGSISFEEVKMDYLKD